MVWSNSLGCLVDQINDLYHLFEIIDNLDNLRAYSSSM